MPNPSSERLPVTSSSSAHRGRFMDDHPNVRPLSRTTVAYAKWILSGDDAPDHRGQTLATRNPHVIRTWADARDAIPVKDDGEALLLDFPFDGDGQNSALEPVGWKAWLEAFEERELVFLYQETLANGRASHFFRLDAPEPDAG